MEGIPSLKTSDRRIIALVNQKGGVGKTVSLISLAAWLAEKGEKVLLIDGDPQGNLSLFFQEQLQTIEQAGDLTFLFRELIEKSTVSEPFFFIYEKVRSNIDIIPLTHSRIREELSENQLADITLLFSDFIRELKNRYNWILIDSSPSNGRLEKMLIAASESVFIPLELQLFSISGLKSLLTDIKNVGRLVRKNIMIDALIFTKIEKRLLRTREYQELFDNFQIPVFEVHKSEQLVKSIENKETLCENAPGSVAAQDYLRIVRQRIWRDEGVSK